jgi:hypothetical protein
MMHASRPLVLILLSLTAGVMMTGCAAPPPKPAPAPVIVPATPDQAADAQKLLQTLKPGARVGHISAVDASNGIAVVFGIPIGEVHLGDSIQFVDGNLTPITSGTVKSADTVNPDYPFLIVHFEPVFTGRSPAKGDLAAYLPR